jgi:MFS family permease
VSCYPKVLRVSYLTLLTTYPRTLSFSVLFAFFSAPGQTFFLAFFLPLCALEAGLSATHMSTLYAAATLASAALLPWAGKWSDRVSILRVAVIATALLGTSALILSVSRTVWLLFPALLFARFAGQGLFTHISHTSAARHDKKIRGKALGIASLGYPLAEGLVPLIVAVAIGSIGWRPTLIVVGLMLLLAVLPLSLWLAPRETRTAPSSGTMTAAATGTSAANTAKAGQATDEAPFWRDTAFLMNLPASIIFSSLFTGLLLFHVTWADTMGWSAAWIAACFAGFALSRVTASIASGPWVDRYGARPLFLLHLVPFTGALIVAALFTGPWVPLVFFAGAGFTAGMGNIKTALWTELYGSHRIGAVRGLSAALTVAGTAIGPMVLGAMQGWIGDVRALFPVSLGLVLLAWIPAVLHARPEWLGMLLPSGLKWSRG